ncbi:MAG: hypothetical protein K6G84_09705 [Lachnospiraceae bacterium]|nr:hypothetical protein [Lachnospiraceae bacterium]
MDTVFAKFEVWFKDMLVPVIMETLRTMFDAVNDQVSTIASDVATTPSAFSPHVFSMIRNVSENVIMPIAGMILTFIACYELIQLIMSYNNLANFESWFIFKWVFKTAIAVLLISHTFDFTMAVFDVTQHVILNAGGIISGTTAVDASTLAGMEADIRAMSGWAVFTLYIQILIVQLFTLILSKIIFVIIYCRIIEIYMYVSLAPIPFATFGNKEQSSIGQNYVRSLFALGFQGFLILICVGIYAVLIHTLTFSSDIVGSLWGVMGYTILLAFSLFKTNTIAKAVFQGH